MEENAKYETKQIETKETLPAIQQDSFFAAIERLAVNPDVDVEKIKQIMDMQEHILDRNAKQAFNAAMVEAQREMPIVPEDKKNTQTNSMYSSYKMVLKYTKSIYTNAGFSLLFYEGDAKRDGEIRVYADIMHEAGHTETKYVDIPLDDKGIKGTVNKTRPHAKGSSLSYGKGYLIKMIFNIPTGIDDDGNAADNVIMINDQQLLDIQSLQKDAKISEAEFKKRLKKKFQVNKPEDLTETQAISLIKSLEAICHG